MDDFDFIYEKMTDNYDYLRQIMDNIYKKAQSDPTDERYELFQGLGEVAKKMIQSQMEFITAYGDPSIQKTMLEHWDDNLQTLTKDLRDLSDSHYSQSR